MRAHTRTYPYTQDTHIIHTLVCWYKRIRVLNPNMKSNIKYKNQKYYISAQSGKIVERLGKNLGD